MFEKLKTLEEKYEQLTVKISDPNVIQDQEMWQKFCKEHAELEPIIMAFREYKKAKQTIA